jgi:hypothetical protein
MTTTLTTITEMVNSEWIRPVMNAAAKARSPTARFALEIDLVGRATNTAALPQEVSDVGTSGERDALDATEGTDLTSIAFETTEATVSCTEYGILRKVTDHAAESNVMGAQGLYGKLVESGARDMAVVLEDDIASLLDAFATTAGATTVDLSLANMAQAMASLRNNEMPADDGAVYILGSQQGTDYDVALLAATATTLASYFTKPEASNGLDGTLGTFMNAPVLVSSLTDTANAGADTTGGLFIRGDDGRNPESAALVVAIARMIRPELERTGKGRALEITTSMRKGVAEAIDLSGVSLITDA